MSLPKLNRQPIRPEMEKSTDQELWQPTWRCFCCQDTGIVRPLLASLVISEYNFARDLSVVCQNPRCSAGSDYRSNENYDQRFTAGICSELDKLNREDWRLTVQSQFALVQKRIESAMKDKNLRKLERTAEENSIAQYRHAVKSGNWSKRSRVICVYEQR